MVKYGKTFRLFTAPGELVQYTTPSWPPTQPAELHSERGWGAALQTQGRLALSQRDSLCPSGAPQGSTAGEERIRHQPEKNSGSISTHGRDVEARTVAEVLQ